MFMFNKAAVKEVIKDMEVYPKEWGTLASAAGIYESIIKNNVLVTGYGNTKIFSVISLCIGTKEVQLSWFEKYKLEKAIVAWYEQASVEDLGGEL